MKKSRKTESQIMGILEQAESGVPIPDLCRDHGALLWIEDTANDVLQE